LSSDKTEKTEQADHRSHPSLSPHPRINFSGADEDKVKEFADGLWALMMKTESTLSLHPSESEILRLV
jgi:hypothetical protein